MTTLMPIGGNINEKNPVVLREFVRRAGGSSADIVILTQPSGMADASAYYDNLFLGFGIRSARSLDFRSREEVLADSSAAEAVANATGIFISGGVQMRLTAIIGGTWLEAAVLAAHKRGVIIAGTSAGAAVMPKVMFAYGRGGPTPREGIAQFAPGLGLTENIVFDQHFRQRDRLGRLLYLIAAHPGMLGVGIDENTAAIVEDDAMITVAGSGAVTIVDGSEIQATDVANIDNRAPVAVSNARIHVLTEGCSYDIPAKRASIPKFNLK